ncbi:MAG: hypothetical protein KF738_08265, partial [Burkholderiales bacterium]|nr:hypothetical protein [Burkholderiales bacterium]
QQADLLERLDALDFRSFRLRWWRRKALSPLTLWGRTPGYVPGVCPRGTSLIDAVSEEADTA